MKCIPLTQGKVALVDDQDYEELSKHKWYAKFRRGRAYACRDVRANGKHLCLRMHRLITNASAELQVDHVNGDSLNNQRSNLRLCNNSQNQANKAVGCRNKSGYKGVDWDPRHKKWRAQIEANGKKLHLGRFPWAIQAAWAYDLGALKYHGEFANTNEVARF